MLLKRGRVVLQGCTQKWLLLAAHICDAVRVLLWVVVKVLFGAKVFFDVSAGGACLVCRQGAG